MKRSKFPNFRAFFYRRLLKCLREMLRNRPDYGYPFCRNNRKGGTASLRSRTCVNLLCMVWCGCITSQRHTVVFHWENLIKGWFWRTYPRSGFRSGGTCERTLVPVCSGASSECTLVPVFVPGKHPPKPPFWNHPSVNPRVFTPMFKPARKVCGLAWMDRRSANC